MSESENKALGLASKLLGYINSINGVLVVGAATIGAVGYLANKGKQITDLATDNSYLDITSLTTVEPLTVISKDCLTLEILPDVNQVLLSMFCGYYLQAVDTISKIKNIEVVRVLDRLNPNRDGSSILAGRMASDFAMDLQSYPITTLVKENYKYKLPSNDTLSLENKSAINGELNSSVNLAIGRVLNVTISVDEKYNHVTQGKPGKTTYQIDAATGRRYSVTSNKTEDTTKVESRNLTVTIPVTVRLAVMTSGTPTILNIFTGGPETDLVERFYSWKSGRISFFKDLIFAQDLIDNKKKLLMAKDGDVASEIFSRVNKSKGYGLLTNNPSLATCSNLFVITDAVEKELELKLMGKLSNANVRKKVFEETYAMIIVVINRQWERVTIYTRGISSFTELSYNEIKVASKNSKGPDISDIMKSLIRGDAPNF